MNLKESDALVGIGVLSMPTVRFRIVRLDAEALMSLHQTTVERAKGDRAATIRAEGRLD